MRHRVSGRKLGRDTKHRIALFKNLARALVLHGTVTTTEAKGKELKKLADSLVSTAQGESLNSRRTLHQYFGKRDIVNTLVDRVAVGFTNRTSGFTRIERSGVRSGDNTQLVTVSWVVQPETVGSFANPAPTVVPAAKAKPAKKTEQKETAKKVVAPKASAAKKTKAEVKPKKTSAKK